MPSKPTVTAKNPSGKCACGNQCSIHKIRCKACRAQQKIENGKRRYQNSQAKAGKTHLLPGTGTKHQQMTDEDYERVFGRKRDEAPNP